MSGDIRVASVSDVPEGGSIVVDVNGREIGIFNVGGRFFGLANRCPHQYGPACAGAVSGTIVSGPETAWRPEWVRDGEILSCPWHSLEFEIETGACLAFPDLRLMSYPVRAEDGKLFVRLGRAREDGSGEPEA